MRLPLIRVGLPCSSWGVLGRAAACLGDAATLVSAGGLWEVKKGSFGRIKRAAWHTHCSLDSAGFVAMLQGGYRWSIADYVEFVATNGGQSPESGMPCPWDWWSAMDYCCEQQIAPDRAKVLERVDLTVQSYAETLEHLEWWRGEGVNDVPDPLPILQGRLPADYLRCAEGLVAAAGPLPELVGLGSVCRRDLQGPDGLLRVMDALHHALPPHVKLHLFGVKGEAMAYVSRWPDRVASIDSMAWDYADRKQNQQRRRDWARKTGSTMKQANKQFPSSVISRAATMRRWYLRQTDLAVNGLRQPTLALPSVPTTTYRAPRPRIDTHTTTAPPQLSLFG